MDVHVGHWGACKRAAKYKPAIVISAQAKLMQGDCTRHEQPVAPSVFFSLPDNFFQNGQHCSYVISAAQPTGGSLSSDMPRVIALLRSLRLKKCLAHLGAKTRSTIKACEPLYMQLRGVSSAIHRGVGALVHTASFLKAHASNMMEQRIHLAFCLLRSQDF